MKPSQLIDDAEILPAMTPAGGRMNSKSAHVRLVNHRLVPWPAQRHITLPVKSLVWERTERHADGGAIVPAVTSDDKA